jgi:hypothetical protein
MFDIGSSYLFHVKVIKSDANFGKKQQPQKAFRKGGGREKVGRR